MEIIERRKREQERVIKSVQDWARSLPFKSTVILVGSYARGDFNLWSDIDVVLIAEFTEPPLERLKKIDAPPGFEVIPLTPKEFIEQLKKRNPLVLEAIEHGIVVRDDYNIRELVKHVLGSKILRSSFPRLNNV